MSVTFISTITELGPFCLFGMHMSYFISTIAITQIQPKIHAHDYQPYFSLTIRDFFFPLKSKPFLGVELRRMSRSFKLPKDMLLFQQRIHEEECSVRE